MYKLQDTTNVYIQISIIFFNHVIKKTHESLNFKGVDFFSSIVSG